MEMQAVRCRSVNLSGIYRKVNPRAMQARQKDTQKHVDAPAERVSCTLMQGFGNRCRNRWRLGKNTNFVFINFWSYLHFTSSSQTLIRYFITLKSFHSEIPIFFFLSHAPPLTSLSTITFSSLCVPSLFFFFPFRFLFSASRFSKHLEASLFFSLC